MTEILLGQTLIFTGNPLSEGPAAVRHERRGGVLVKGGRVLEAGAADTILARYPGATRHDFGDALISPGFVDAHAHYPQTGIIASWGSRLIEWLQTYTFPEEARFDDPVHARAVAGRYLDLLLDHGTTTVCSYATSHRESVEALFEAAEARGMRILAGKTCMDRNAPDLLLDTPERAHEESAALIARWHGRGRARYAITPRFAPTSSAEQLEALGALWAAHPDCLMQTHLSEQAEEIAWVRDLFPDARDYLDVYERFGLIGPGALYGHCIHLEPRERARLAETGAVLVHCPTSNSFIGSGLFDMPRALDEGQRVALATDTGGGSSFSMLRTMAAAYEVAQLRGRALHPAQLWWLATGAGAAALGLEGVIGTIAPGAEADLVIIDLASTPAIAQRTARAGDIWEALFPTIMMGDDRAVQAVMLRGRLHRRD